MKKMKLNQTELSLKLASIMVATMLVISSTTMSIALVQTSLKDVPEQNHSNQSFQKRACKATAVLAQEGLWITADSSLEGTPAEAHVTISDTSGITIVADFHGFWLDNCTIDSTSYYDLEMPGASSIQAYGKPVLPCLFEYVQIPYGVDIHIEILNSTLANVSEYITEYEIKPGPFPEFPSPIGEGNYDGSSVPPPDLFFDPVYANGTFFPGITTNTEGELNSTSMIMRGHRLLGLSFYPVQYNNASSELIFYSQLIIKLKYSFSAQIENVPKWLYSKTFEYIIGKCVLNCLHTELALYEPGIGLDIVYPTRRFFWEGAEYLIITTGTFEKQAQRLADWKERKGVPSKVHVIPDSVVDIKQHVKWFLSFAYYNWFPVPTYVLLLGDVEHIPTNYDMEHLGKFKYGYTYETFFKPGDGKIASDFGYFNIEGNGLFPDMIYSRISVDTELQAEIIVNKTLNYEISPPTNPTFYENFLSAGYFQDRNPRDGIEDYYYPMIFTLERIRHYLTDTYGYTAHINYSAAMNIDDSGWVPEEFQEELYGSTDVMASVSRQGYFPNFEWLWGYDWLDDNAIGDKQDYFNDLERGNITPNFDEGRFLVLYMGHGGSKNMYNFWNVLAGFNPTPGVNVVDYRDTVEGWQHPFLNTSYLADLTNGNMTPLVINIACNTGWFDGETDQEVLYPNYYTGPGNPFSECASECLAENITRLEGGGAIAVIASSRQAYIPISKHLMNGLIQAFWPGFLGSENQPIYEIGGALLFAKIFAVNEYGPVDFETVYEYERAEDFHPRDMMVQEYHLFGDPETQLWTDVPWGLSVEYPDKLGLGDQEFAVTVTYDIITQNYSVPVSNAKICLQKGSDIYQVGYTDSRGQVIFNVHPSCPGMMNLTVTAHNFIPHLGEIECLCNSATLTLTPEEGPFGSLLNLYVHGFPNGEDVEIFYESLYKTTLSSGAPARISAPTGRYGFTNIIAKGVVSNHVAVAVYRCYSSMPQPDPYIYSQWDESTWGMAGVSGLDIGWENPDIVILDDGIPIELSSVSPTTTYTVRIEVHNQGDTEALHTNVFLRNAPIGGGASWSYVGVDYIESIAVGDSEYAYIPWRPPAIRKDYCLKAIIDCTNDKNLDNNVGVLAVQVMEYLSPAETEFVLGNPTDSDSYVFVNVRQQGNHSNVWNATILSYSSQIINSTLNETILVQIDPGPDLEQNEWRMFVVDVYVKCQLVGGVQFNVSKMQVTPTTTLEGIDIVTLALIIGGIILGVIVLVFVYKRR